MMKEVKPKRWKTSSTSVYHIGYHLIWCPKFRRKVLTRDIELRLKELLPESAGMARLTDGSKAPCL